MSEHLGLMAVFRSELQIHANTDPGRYSDGSSECVPACYVEAWNYITSSWLQPPPMPAFEGMPGVHEQMEVLFVPLLI